MESEVEGFEEDEIIEPKGVHQDSPNLIQTNDANDMLHQCFLGKCFWKHEGWPCTFDFVAYGSSQALASSKFFGGNLD